MIQLIQELPDIEKKLAEAPDNSYAIGILIGNFLPVTVLIVLAYLLYAYMKRNKNNDFNFD